MGSINSKKKLLKKQLKETKKARKLAELEVKRLRKELILLKERAAQQDVQLRLQAQLVYINSCAQDVLELKINDANKERERLKEATANARVQVHRARTETAEATRKRKNAERQIKQLNGTVPERTCVNLPPTEEFPVDANNQVPSNFKNHALEPRQGENGIILFSSVDAQPTAEDSISPYISKHLPSTP